MRRELGVLRLLSALTLSSALAASCAPTGVDDEDAGEGPPLPVLPVHRDDDAGPAPRDGGGQPGADGGSDGGAGQDGGSLDDGGPPGPPSCGHSLVGERFGVCDGRLSLEAATEGARFGVAGRIEVGAREPSGPRFGVSGGELHVP